MNSKSRNGRVSVSGVVFDLDGTLTRPHAIDFGAMRRRIGMPMPGSVLHWIKANARSEAEADEMYAVVDDEELRGLERMQLGEGLPALVEVLVERGMGLATGIATRNSEDALLRFDSLMRAEGFPPATDLFGVRLPRDHVSSLLGRQVANKPSPEPAHEILRTWGILEKFPITQVHEAEEPLFPELLFVGDGLDDCLCGRRAGWDATLLTNGEASAHAGHVAARQAHASLGDVAELLRLRG